MSSQGAIVTDSTAYLLKECIKTYKPVLTTACAAQAGERLSECRQVAEHACAHSGVLFIVETLEFIHRGGRIGGALAFLGTVLNIKPVLEI